MKKVLLHICCGVCVSSVVERLRCDGYAPIGYFYNPNIHPLQEYLRRKQEVEDVAKILKFNLIESEYNKDQWLQDTKGLGEEPEGLRRCQACFKIRLKEVNNASKRLGISFFTTTLTVSPYKNAEIINRIGKQIDSQGFLIYDFKKQGGFKLAIDFSKQYNIYRQDYCGCIYSKNTKQNI